MADEAKSEPAKSAEPTAKKSKKKPTAKPARKRPAKRKTASAAKPQKPRTPRARVPAKPRARRRESTPAERAKILAAADRDGLTALQVQKRFGVKPVTYYSWRKATKRSGAKRAARRGVPAGIGLVGQLRTELRARIAEMLPEIIRSEVAAALGALEGKRKR